MLMGKEENGRDIEGFQATLYTQRKINQATQNVRMYNTPPQKGRGPNNKSGQTKLRWNELEKRESSRRRRRRTDITITITRRVYLRFLLLRMITDSGKKVKIAGSKQVTQMTDRLLTSTTMRGCLPWGRGEYDWRDRMALMLMQAESSLI